LSNAEHDRLEHLAHSVLPSPALGDNERRIVVYRMKPEGFSDAVRLAWAGQRGDVPAADWAGLLALPEQWPVPRFPVSGSDLARRGVASGPEMGRLLKRLEDWWMDAGFPEKDAVLQHFAALTSER
jgi:poly(A) polymerase